MAAHLPPALRDVAAAAARQAFMDGLRSGSLVAAGATAALATLAFLPARVRHASDADAALIPAAPGAAATQAAEVASHG